MKRREAKTRQEGREGRKQEGRKHREWKKRREGGRVCIFVILFNTFPGSVRIYSLNSPLWDTFVLLTLSLAKHSHRLHYNY